MLFPKKKRFQDPDLLDTEMSEETLGSKLGNPEDKVIDALGQKIMSEWNDAKFARQEQEKVSIS